MRDLTDAEVQAMGYAVGLELDGTELTEVAHSLNAILEMMDALEVPGPQRRGTRSPYSAGHGGIRWNSWTYPSFPPRNWPL